MRSIISSILALVAIALCFMALTMNWPSVPGEFSPGSYDVSWGWYIVALLLGIAAFFIYWWPSIKRGYRFVKRHGGGGEHQRLVTYGIGYKQYKERKNV
jgi:hypothetical protein